MMYYDIDYARFGEVASKVVLGTGWNCTSSLCCFQGKLNPKGSNEEMMLVVGTVIKHAPLNGQTLDQLLCQKPLRVKYRAYEADAWLVPEFVVSNDVLNVRFKCKNYTARPDVCREYPRDGRLCDMETYANNPQGQLSAQQHNAVIDGARMAMSEFRPIVMMYALHENLVDRLGIDLTPFSVGKACTWLLTKYLLIPVPNKPCGVKSPCQPSFVLQK